MVSALQHASFIAYLLSCVFFFRYISKDDRTTERGAYALATAGLIFQLFPLAIIVRDAGYFPLENPFIMLSLFAACILVIFLIFSHQFRFAISGTFVMPLVAFAAATQLVMDEPRLVLPLALQSTLFTLHILLVTVAFSFFFLCACTGVFYLIMEDQLKNKKQGTLFHRIPSIGSLIRMRNQALAWGFMSYTAGILVSVYWSIQLYGVSVLSGDPKVLISFCTWLLYGLLYVAAKRGIMDPRQSSLAVIASLFLIIIALFGIGHIFPRNQL